MADLPSKLPILDGEFLPTTESLVRIEPAALKEAHYDKLLAQSAPALTELLQDAGTIAKDSVLELLDSQKTLGGFGRVDLIFAEVGPSGQFRRVALVEDKLVRNPEARFHVLGQLLRYAYALRQMDHSEFFPHPVRGPSWVDDNRYAIMECLAEGNFVLVIAGDRMHGSLQGMLSWFRSELPASMLSEVVTISLAIYQGAGTTLLVPSLTGVLRLDRTTTVRVRIAGHPGAPQLLEETEQVSQARAQATQEEFFAGWQETPDQASNAKAAQAVLAALQAAAIPGVHFGETDRGAPTVELDTRVGTAKVFNVQKVQQSFAEGLHMLAIKTETATPAINAFRAHLVSLGGTATATGRVHLPIKVAASQVAAIVQGVRDLAATLENLE